MSAHLPRALRPIGRAAAGLGLGLLLAELAFYARDGGAFPHLNVYAADPVRGLRLRPDAETKVRFGGSAVTRVRLDGAGYRGASGRPWAEGGVLVVGDSQAFGLGVEAEEAFAARLGGALGAPVYNAGVPTYGPPEFAQVIDELAPKLKPKTVVYVVNFANDAFEAERPNRGRHVAWDGWAVRRETAPASVVEFPGRGWLFGRSHAFYAARQLWYRAGGPERDAEGAPSEGTWRDLLASAEALRDEQARTVAELERQAAGYEAEAAYARESARSAESRVRALVFRELKLKEGFEPAGEEYAPTPGELYRAAGGNPGDIVVPGFGEEGRPVAASAKYLREAARLRQRLEAELRRRAEEAADSPEAREILGALSERDRLEARLSATLAKPLEVARASSPLARAVLGAKARAEAAGARFVLLFLPLDVMVSEAEWSKHRGGPVDLRPARVLVDDLLEAVRGAGATALDATEALAAAEPGAFLPGDLHMTPKGHEAVAAALAAALRAGPPAKSPAPLVALAEGRSRPPPPEAWDKAPEIAVLGSEGCTAKKLREWLYVRCAPWHGPKVTGLEVTRGGLGEATAAVADGAATLVAPTPPGADLEAVFGWEGRPRKLVVRWGGDRVVPDMGFVDAAGAAPPKPGDAAASDALCACHRQVSGQPDCSTMVAAPDPDCLRTFAGDCARLLACASGDPARAPRCPAGHVNAGAALHCSKLCAADAECGAAAACVEDQGVKRCVPR
ncbi:MAG TPA: hypothetical protein VFS43_01995 [Polyangiaceae bacterium]|nr:hypothetical protein [Polyangiaceae bacterium]